ncbi:MAG: peptidoglycan editing factor PgeF [Blautia sp.]|jgi:YfiH family protein
MEQETWIWHDEELPKMKRKERNGVVYLTYPAFEETGLVAHGFSTRLGGVSRGIWESMNLSYTRGDDPAHVKENFHRMADAVGVPYESIVTSDQTHTSNVRVVTEKDRGSGITRPRDYTDVDGMITDVPELTLATFYADCVPLYFLDPRHKAIGLSHSGWRGTVAKIGKVTVEAMTREYGTDPADVLAAIGPSICQDCYEVSEDVIQKVQESFRQELWQELYYAKENGKYQLNLWKANEQIFLEAGILPEHISLPNLCTCCNPKLLFSHRASQGKRGNLGAFLMLKRAASER